MYIAAIGGPCGGGGLELSVCFDVRLAADDLLDTAVKLAATYSRRNRETVAAQKRIFNEHHALSPADSLRREGALSAASASAPAAVRALRE